MAVSINRATILGTAGRPAEVRTTSNGTPVANFTIATTARWKAKDGTPREEVTWHHVTAWGTLATICQQVVQQGRKLYIDGPICVEHFEAKDGTRKTKTFIKADQVVSLATGRDRVENGGEGIVRTTPSRPPQKQEPTWDVIEMPF